MNDKYYWFLVVPKMELELKEFCRIYHPDDQQAFLRRLYVIHWILFNKNMYKELYKNSGVLINRDLLAQKVLRIPNKKASEVIKNLLSWQFIDIVRHHSEGRSRTYRLNIRWEGLKATYRRFDQNDAHFIGELIMRRGVLLKSSQGLCRQYKILTEKTRVNKEGLSYLRSKYQNQFLNKVLDEYILPIAPQIEFSEVFNNIEVDYQDIGLLGIVIKAFFVERPDPLSRVYTNLTSLKREHRKFVSIDEKPLMMTDIINSQIVFSVAVIQNYFKMVAGKKCIKYPSDFIRYRTEALNGSFYESLASGIPIPIDGENRKAFKKAFFQQVFFSKVRTPLAEIKLAFKRKYPTTSKAINKLKQKGHAQFAIKLQRLEASIVIDDVLKQMCNEGKTVLSLHDSIIVNNEGDLRYAETLLTAKMVERFGLHPKFKRE